MRPVTSPTTLLSAFACLATVLLWMTAPVAAPAAQVGGDEPAVGTSGVADGPLEASETAMRDAVTVPVLVYHHIRPETKGRPAGARPYEITPDEFAAHLDLLAELGFTTIGFRDLAASWKGGPLPERPVILTFDDGAEEQLGAWRSLRERGLTGSFFVFTNAIDRPNYLSWDALREMRDGGAEILSHTVYHPYLTKADDETLAVELAKSKRTLEEGLGEDVDVLAWPFGLSDDRTRAAAIAAGYTMARGLTQTNAQRADAPMSLGGWIATGDVAALKRILLLP